jgi:DNA polymerase delta subunit 1
MVIFQHLDTQLRGGQIILFGRTEHGKSVAVKIQNYMPHAVIRVEGDIDALKSRIKESVLLHSACKWKSKDEEAEAVEKDNAPFFWDIVDGQDIVDYKEDGCYKFLKIRVKMKYFYSLKQVLSESCDYIDEQKEGNESKYRWANGYMLGKKYKIYNGQVDAGLQYLIEKDIYSCTWMEISGKEVTNQSTSCDMEIIGYMNTHKQLDKIGMAPWRIMTYDIECVPRPIERAPGKYDFPKATIEKKDDSGNIIIEPGQPICTIGAVVQIDDTLKQIVWIYSPDSNRSYTLPAVDKTDEYESEKTEIKWYDSEKKMLKEFCEYIKDEDIDIIEGYNSSWFDHPYVFDRYKLFFNVYPTWGRIKNLPSRIKYKVFQSNQAGKNVTKQLYSPGRIDHDGYQVMKKNHNLMSYKLDEVAKQFLGTKKYPMDYSEIYPKFHTKDGREELAVYCVKDAWLTRKIMHKLSKLYVSFQLASVTGIGLNEVLNRGQGIRSISLMLRYCKRRKPEYFIPKIENRKKRKRSKLGANMTIETTEEEVTEGFQGAVVLDPKPNFYKDAIVTLDFASLYPSIVQCMNMSYETIISRETMVNKGWEEGKEVRAVPDYSYVNGRMKTKINYNTNVIFATKETRKGILPEIMDSLLQERRRVKKEMKKHHPDSVPYKIANGRQLGLKVCANSIYGFTGASVGFLPEKRIAESVTKYGRGLTLKTQDLIENHPVWGGEHGVKCVYGDTDSVFCHLPRSLCDGKTPEETVKRAEEIGKEMGEYVDAHFLRPVELEFEKVYLPFMLIKKKRYCGKKYEEGHVKIDMKGLECVRRDYCPLLVKTQKKMLMTLMETMEVEKACKVVSEAMEKLSLDQIPLEDLTMSKKLSRSPGEYKAMAAHVNLAKRINKERGIEHGFVAGDRVPFVIANGLSSKVSESAVLPEEITSGKFTVNRGYYRNKQMIPPLTRILEKLCDNPKTLFLCNSFRTSNISGTFSTWKTERKRTVYKREEKRIQKKKRKVTIKDFF